MKKLWVIARKDIREAFRSRSVIIYIILLFFLTFTYFNSYNAAVNRIGQDASPDVFSQISQAFINNIFGTLPMMYSVLICSVFAAYAVIVEKTRRNLESLMAAPVSLNQIWLGKALAVTVPSYVIALGVTVLAYVVMSFVAVEPRVGSFIIPDATAIVTAIVIIPVLVFLVVAIVTYLQLVISNPRIANIAFTVIFLALYFGVTALVQLGVAIDFRLIYAGMIVVLGAVTFLLSRTLTKERVLLSSKV